MTGSRCFKFSVTLHIETNGNARYSMTVVCCLLPLGRRKHDIYTNGCVTHIIPLLLCLESHLQHSFLPSWMPYVSSWPATFLVITLVGGNQPFCLAVIKIQNANNRFKAAPATHSTNTLALCVTTDLRTVMINETDHSLMTGDAT